MDARKNWIKKGAFDCVNARESIQKRGTDRSQNLAYRRSPPLSIPVPDRLGDRRYERCCDTCKQCDRSYPTAIKVRFPLYDREREPLGLRSRALIARLMMQSKLNIVSFSCATAIGDLNLFTALMRTDCFRSSQIAFAPRSTWFENKNIWYLWLITH